MLGCVHAFLDAFEQRSPNATGAYTECIDRNSKLFGQLLSVICLCPSFFLVILKDEFAIVRRQLLHTVLQTFIFTLVFVPLVSGRQRRNRFAPQIFEMNLVRYAIEIPGSIACKG